MDIPAAPASRDGFNAVPMTEYSHITNFQASANVRNLPSGQDAPNPHNANMDRKVFQDKNYGPNHVRAWRKVRGLTAEVVAEKVGASKGNYSDLENGNRGMTLRWLRLISEALNVPAGILADYAPEDVPPDVFDALRETAAVPTVEDLTEIVQAILDTPKPPRELASSAAEELAKAVQYTLGRLAVRPEIRGNPAAIQEAFAAGFDLPVPHTHQ